MACAERPVVLFQEAVGEGPEGPGLWILMLHEFLHVGESVLKQAGAIKRRVDHDFIENIPTGLLFLMHQAGMLKDFPIDELLSSCRPAPMDSLSGGRGRSPGGTSACTSTSPTA